MKIKKKILLIDDEEQARQLMSDILVPRGYEFFSAKDGSEGISMAKEVHPDLVLLDVMMPVMDGFKVLELLKGDESTKNIPVVFITAKTSLQDTVYALSKGAAGYIEKPFDIKRLIRKIEPFLNQA